MIKSIQEKINHCINCINKPCSNKGCPLNNDIPSFIQALKTNDYNKAFEIISQTSVLPSVCGRICPHKKQCEASCIKSLKGDSVSIGELETHIADNINNEFILKEIYQKEVEEKYKSKKVAIIGGGPAGLTAAAFLAKKGINVTIYEKYNYLGGLLIHGIPDFRLKRSIVEKEIKKILNLDIKVKYNQELNSNLELSYLEKNYDKVLLTIGANKGNYLNIKGEYLSNVYLGNYLLEHQNHPNYQNKDVVIIGGGNVAIDCARTIKRLNPKSVKIIYRKQESEMPAELSEIKEAKDENIEFIFNTTPAQIIGTTKVEEIELIKTKYNNKVLENIPNSNYKLKTDVVVLAIGATIEDYVKDLNIKTNTYQVQVNENKQTSKENIYAAGDIIGNKGTVAKAAASGKRAAFAILKDFEKEL